MMRRLRLIVLPAAFAAAFATPLFSQSSTSPEKGKSQGTRRTVKNPLNELLEQARMAIERNDFQAALDPKKRSLLMEKCPKRSSISAFYFSNPIPPPPSRLYPRQWIFWPRKVAPGSSSVWHRNALAT